MGWIVFVIVVGLVLEQLLERRLGRLVDQRVRRMDGRLGVLLALAEYDGERDRELEEARALRREGLDLVMELKRALSLQADVVRDELAATERVLEHARRPLSPRLACAPLPELKPEDVGQDERETLIATPAEMAVHAGDASDGEERETVEELTQVFLPKRVEDIGEQHVKRALRHLEDAQGVVGLGTASYARIVLERARKEGLGVSDVVEIVSDIERSLAKDTSTVREAGVVAGSITARILARKATSSASTRPARRFTIAPPAPEPAA